MKTDVSEAQNDLRTLSELTSLYDGQAGVRTLVQVLVRVLGRLMFSPA